MPDKLGFDHLGNTYKCIFCFVSYPFWGISEAERARHARKHAKERAAMQAASEAEREKINSGEWII